VPSNHPLDHAGRGSGNKKLLAVWEWHGEGAEYCRDCAKMHKQAGRELNCKDCDGRCPDLLASNRRVFELLATVWTQWRVGINGPVGLDYPAVYQTAAVMGIKITPIILRKIRAVERQALEVMHSGKE